MSHKETLYSRDLDRFAAKAKAQYPQRWHQMTFAGYEAWCAGYKAGFAAGKLKGIKTTTEICSWLRSPIPSSPLPKE